MEIILAIITVVFGISLYDHFASRKWAQVTSHERNEMVFEHRNRAYGAYAIRKSYNTWLLIILLCVIGGIGVAFGIYKIIQAIPEEVVPPPPVDDDTFAVAAPPMEDEEVPPPPPEPEIPEMQKTIQFLPPVVTDDAEAETDPPTQEDMDNTAAGQTDNQGGDDFGTTAPTNNNPPIDVQPVNDEPATIVDEKAEFPGGMAALKKFLGDNLSYPQTAVDEEIEGKVYLRFVVDKNGEISRVSVTRGIADCPECDKEAVRVVKKMPKWAPGKNGGKAVDSYYNLPITFKLQ